MENNLGPENFSGEYELQGAGIKKPTLAQISILYSLTVILLQRIGFRAQAASLYPGLLITEFGLVLIPSLGLLYIYRYDIKSVLRLNRVKPLSLLLIFCIMLFALPVVGVLNLVNLLVINSIFGRVIMPDLPAATNSVELIRNILVIAGSAAICEEIMFRGIIQRGMERFGAVKAILVTAFLFGLLHLDFQRLLGTFLLGALIGFLVYRSNSIYSGMFAHFCNNSFAVVAAYMGTRLNEFTKTTGLGKTNASADQLFSAFEKMPKEQLAGVIVVWGFMFMAALILLTGCLIGYLRITSDNMQKVTREKAAFKKAGLLWLTPGLFFVVLMYFAEGLRLKEAASPLAKSILKFMGMG